MLKTSGQKIVDGKGREIILRSIGVGGWLMMEGYMLGGRNIPEHVFKAEIARLYGRSRLISFTSEFQKHFFNESDVIRIKKLGFNCVRLPMNYRVISYDLLDKVVGWFKKHKVYLILDLHAAPGSQNYDWHSDSDGVSRLWDSKKYIDQTLAIWDGLSKRYRNEDIIAGYDILNEPVTDQVDKVNRLFSDIIRTIRKNGDKHILFIEPNMWAQSFKSVKNPKDDNFAWSIHFYLPLYYTFNWDPMLDRPDKKYLRGELTKYRKIQLRDNVPMLVGEFGVASRCSACNDELKWVRDVLAIFKEFGWSWSYWTYKSVAGALVPDGLYRIFDHEAFRRESSSPGMENIYRLLKSREKELYRKLGTNSFTLHKELYNILRKG